MQSRRKKFEDTTSDPYLDESDSAILRSLQADARTTLARVGRAAGLSPSSVHERIRRLQRDGVIRGWTLELDPRAVGRPVTAFVGVEADVTGGTLAARLRLRPEVDECHSIAGDLSFFLKVRSADTEALLGAERIVTCKPSAANSPRCFAMYRPAESSAGTAATVRSVFSRPPAAPAAWALVHAAASKAAAMIVVSTVVRASGFFTANPRVTT